MRDCWKNRRGYDRVLMTVAATFLTVSAGSAFAQNVAPRKSAAELAIDAAGAPLKPAPPPPDPAKPDTNKADANKATEQAAAPPKPADLATAPISEPTKVEPAKEEANKADPSKNDATKNDTATVAPAQTPAPAATAASPEPAKEPVKAVSDVPAEDQPVADKLREAFGAKAQRYFDRKAERTAVEKFYTARDFAPAWTQGGKLTDSAKGVVARLKDAASDGLNPWDYPIPDFAAATSPDALADSDLKLTASMLDYARHAQSGRMHWSQVSGDIQYPEHPTDPTEVLANVTSAKDASLALDGYNPPHKLYRALKKKLAELRGQGDGPVIQIADGPMLKFIPA